MGEISKSQHLRLISLKTVHCQYAWVYKYIRVFKPSMLLWVLEPFLIFGITKNHKICEHIIFTENLAICQTTLVTCYVD